MCRQAGNFALPARQRAGIGGNGSRPAGSEKLLGRAVGDDPSGLDEDQPRRNAQRILRRMGHQHRRHPRFGMKFMHQVCHVAPKRRAERGERLVEQQYWPVAHQRARQRDALALATGQLARQPLLLAGEAGAVKRRGNAGDIAHAIAFFADQSAGFVTGQTLHVNGGWVMD